MWWSPCCFLLPCLCSCFPLCLEGPPFPVPFISLANCYLTLTNQYLSSPNDGSSLLFTLPSQSLIWARLLTSNTPTLLCTQFYVSLIPLYKNCLFKGLFFSVTLNSWQMKHLIPCMHSAFTPEVLDKFGKRVEEGEGGGKTCAFDYWGYRWFRECVALG